MPKAYWIARVTVRDPERYKDYISTARPALERFNARFLARGGAVDELEGSNRPRNVIIEFPDRESALACYNSPEYQAAKAIREQVSEADLAIVQGHDPEA